MNARKVGLGLLDAIVKIAFIVIVVMLITKYAKIGYNYGYQLFNQKPVSSGTGRTVTVTIANGDSAGAIADKLAGVGLITDKKLFMLQERFSEYHGMEKPGTYELSTAMTPEEMLQIMSGGKKAGESSEDSQQEGSGQEDSQKEESASEDSATEEESSD